MEFPLLLWPPVPLEVNSEKWVKNCPLATGPIIIYRLCLIQSGDNIRNHQIQALPLFPQIFEIILQLDIFDEFHLNENIFVTQSKNQCLLGSQCLALSWIKWKENFCYFLHSSNKVKRLLDKINTEARRSGGLRQMDHRRFERRCINFDRDPVSGHLEQSPHF